ncbi:MAG: IclR family transcriptional regulator [Desulfobacterales bacterium]|nr:IclR family transcriptional regulator [Desulfobacterales bacterium]
MTEKKKSQGRIIQSVDRSISALLLFLEDVQELGIKDFSEKLDLPKPTIHSLINTMTARQLLEQNPENSKYRLGPALFRLGIQYVRQSDVLSTVSIHAERLCYKFSKSVNVCMLVGGQVVVVYKVDPDQAVIAYPDVGAVVPLHNTANGKLLLAFAEPEVRAEILADLELIKSTEATITDPALFEAELDSVRSGHISYNRGEGVSGIYAISGPIYNHRDQVIASFAISGKEDFFKENEQRLVGEVKKTAQAMSKHLGYTGQIYTR